MALGEAGFHIPADPQKFSFDAEVAEIFDDMAKRSLPGYDYAYARIREYAATLDIPKYSQVWDFGVSTGKGLQSVQLGARHPFIHYMGCDISDPMIAKAKANCPWAEIEHHDLTYGLPSRCEKDKVAIAIFGWTLQFVTDRIGTRQWLIRQAYDRLMPGGLLFVMEKFDIPLTLGEGLNNAYYKWRRDNGYSLVEIEAKSVALQAAMHPWTHFQLEKTLDGLKPSEWMWMYRLFNFGGVVIKK